MNSHVSTSSMSSSDSTGPDSNSRKDANGPSESGSKSESVDVESNNPSVVNDSKHTSIVVEDVELKALESIENDGVNDSDIESSSARDVTRQESTGVPGDGFDDDSDSEDLDIGETEESLASPCYLKIVIGSILLIVIFFVIFDAAVGKNYVRQAITAFLEWVRENTWAGAIAYILVYFVCTLICVPGALLTLGAGFVFSSANDGSLVAGAVLGTLVVFVGSSTGAIVAFLLARYLLYDRVRRLSQRYSIFEALDVALSEKGFRIMCLLRLSPITPFVLLNYIAGVTTVKLSCYMLSIFCMLPGMVLYVFLGASAGTFMDKNENKTVTIIAVTIGVIFGVLAIGLTSHYSRKELNKEVDLVRSRLYNRTTSRRNRARYRRSLLRMQRSRYRRRIDRKRAGR